MAKYIELQTQPQFVVVDFFEQLLPGTFEHALNHLIDHQLDLSHFDARYCNDETGAPAYPPAMLLKVILFAYSKGVVGSRPIAQLCRTHVTFIALSGDTQPHFTTLARFVSQLGDDIATVFAAVLAVCQQQGLVGGELFAIDGVKLPSQASKHNSGTRADFERQASRLETHARRLLAHHETLDGQAVQTDRLAQQTQKIERLNRNAGELRDWLAAHPNDRLGVNAKPIKSNRTDNESAKSTGCEQALLMPMVDATAAFRNTDTLITADSGFHNKDNIVALDAMGRERPHR